MRALIRPRESLPPEVRVPASKSHTIRRLLIAALAEGISVIEYPLDSLDARSCAALCRALGAEIEEHRGRESRCPNPPDERGEKLLRWVVKGRGARSSGGLSPADKPSPGPPTLRPAGPPLPPAPGEGGVPPGPRLLDVGNSGTTLFLALSVAALGTEELEFTGDEQIRRRSAGPLLEALRGLGVRAEARGPEGCAPIIIQGPWKGGRVSLPCPTSQYLSSLLLAAPLAPAGTVTEIAVPLLNERPYVELTLSYLADQGVPWETEEDFSFFRLRGGFSYGPRSGPVPGDFSSAAFPGGAAAISAALRGGPGAAGNFSLWGLDPGDTQGDKAFFEILARMGRELSWNRESPRPGEPPEWVLRIRGAGPLKAGEFDLNATPDLLPILAVMAAYAEGDTALVNVAHARIKETDRIAAMAEELAKLGVRTTERPDGLIIHGGGGLEGGSVDGRGDHRLVMAFAAGALAAAGPVEIAAAESAAVTYPGFLELLGAEARE